MATTTMSNATVDRPMAQSHDPRAVRTRLKLIDAFGRLASSDSPDDITVSALTDAAGVHRSVFYKHFASPDDLATHMLRDLFSALSGADVVMRGQLAVSGIEASRNAMSDLIRFVGARRAVYASLLGPSAPAGAVQSVTDAFAEFTARALDQMAARPSDVDPQMVSRFLAHGVVGVVGRWLSDPQSSLSHDQVVEQLLECFPGWLTSPSPSIDTEHTNPTPPHTPSTRQRK